MKTENSYATSHKGLRNILSQFSLLAGKTDYGNLPEVHRLQVLGKEMIFLLTHHLHTENDDLLQPLEERLHGASQHDLADHERLEQIQADIARQLAALNGTQTPEEGHSFYLAFTSFQSQYLEHILQEELVTEKLLQAHFTNDELKANSARIMQKVDFQVVLQSLKYIVPAQSLPENTELLRTLKANAPAEALQAVLAIIKPVLPEAEYRELVARIE